MKSMKIYSSSIRWMMLVRIVISCMGYEWLKFVDLMFVCVIFL